MRRNKTNQMKRRLPPYSEIQEQLNAPRPEPFYQRLTSEQQESQQRQWKENFTDYLKSLCTKGSENEQPKEFKPTVSGKHRNTLLQQIQREKGEEETEIFVDDIADYVQKSLRTGWKSLAVE
jgi:hypothetical protein